MLMLLCFCRVFVVSVVSPQSPHDNQNSQTTYQEFYHVGPGLPAWDSQIDRRYPILREIPVMATFDLWKSRQ